MSAHFFLCELAWLIKKYMFSFNYTIYSCLKQAPPGAPLVVPLEQLDTDVRQGWVDKVQNINSYATDFLLSRNQYYIRILREILR